MTHLREVLSKAQIDLDVVEKVVVWGRQETLDLLDNRTWLKKRSPSEIKYGWLSQIYWQKFRLPKHAILNGCDILFVPGGNHSGNFNPVVTISQNLLPFEWTELTRYGWSVRTLRFILRKLEASTKPTNIC